MPTEVIMPRVDMDMSEGRISRWYVEEGAKVAKGQPIFEIETEKAAMEVEAPASGVIRDLSTTLDVPLPVGSVIATIDDAGELAAAAPPGSEPAPRLASAPRPVASEHRAEPAATIAPHVTSAQGDAASSRRATPLARKLARERGLDIFSLAGTGPKGRVQGEDVEKAHLEAKPKPPRSMFTGSVSRAPLHAEWLRRGEGAPVVLIHGFGADLNSWRLFLAAARLGSPVLGIDLPGHGGSVKSRVASFEALLEEVAERLRAESLGALHLVGHSLGGAVAAALSRCAGIEALSLFLVAPAGLGPKINEDFISHFPRARTACELARLIPLLVKDPAVLGPSFIKATLRQRQKRDGGELDEATAALFPGGTQRFSVRSTLDSLAIPAKIVFGAQDQIIPPRHMTGLPGPVAIHCFPELGHMPHLEAPARVAGLLKELMRSTR